MGWSGGTDMCIKVWGSVRKYVPEKDRVKVLAKVIDALTDSDWDCADEIAEEWPEARNAIKKVFGYDPLED